MAAASAAVLAVPLSAIGPAHAVVDRADVSITKTVASLLPPITFDPALRDVRSSNPATPSVSEWTADGLHIRTFDDTDEDKVGEYVTTSKPLSTVGEPSLDYTTLAGAPPGFVLKVDVTGDGVSDGELIGEPTSYGNVWWLNNPRGNPGSFASISSAAAPVCGVNVACASTGMGTKDGTLNQWRAAFAAAKVVGFGLGLGSGVQGEGYVTSLHFSGTSYDLRRAYRSAIDAAPGDTVEYKLVVGNTGTLAATGVIVTDTLPADLTYVPASLVDNGNGCTFTGQSLTCNAGTFPTGSTTTVTYRATLSRQANIHVPATAGHAITTQTKEATLGIAADASASQTATCDPGFIATDGGLHVDPIAGGYYSDLVTTASGPTPDGSSWKVSATNYGDVAAGGKVYVNCINELLGSSSGHTHAVQVSAASGTETATAFGRRVDLTCPAGTRPIAPGFATTSGVGTVRESYPHTAQMWRFIVDYDENTSMSYSARCLADETTTANGHTATLGLTGAISTTPVAPETRVEGAAACPGTKQAIVGGYSGYDATVLSLGKKPTGTGYQFRFYNEDWETASSADMLVTCVGTTTSTEPGAISTTATVSTTELEQNTANNSSTATVKVVGDPPAVVYLGNAASRYVASGKVKGIDIQVRCLVACTFGAKVYKSGTVVAKATKSLGAGTGWRTVRIRTTDAGRSVTAGTIRITLVTSEGTLTANPATLS